MAASGNTSWVCDPSLVSCALEQPEMLRSPDYKHKCCAQRPCAPTVYLQEIWDSLNNKISKIKLLDFDSQGGGKDSEGCPCNVDYRKGV